MREQEVRELYEAYMQVHQPQEEVEQLDEEAPERITKRTKNKRLMKDAGPARVHNPKNVDEEVEVWVNALVEEGYDLSEYTWDDMCEMYLDEARTDPRGRPASGPMSVYGGRGTPSPDPEGDDNVSRMDRAQRRVKRTQPRAKGMAADALFTKYSARQSGSSAGGEEGPGPKAPARGGRKGRGAETDRGSGNAAKRRMSEDFDLFDTILEYLVAEGYADTNESALVIMANMSEEWRRSIVEQTPPFVQDLYDYKDGGGKAKEAQGMPKKDVIELGQKNRDRLTGLKGNDSRFAQNQRSIYTKMGGDARARQLGIRPDGTY